MPHKDRGKGVVDRKRKMSLNQVKSRLELEKLLLIYLKKLTGKKPNPPSYSQHPHKQYHDQRFSLHHQTTEMSPNLYSIRHNIVTLYQYRHFRLFTHFHRFSHFRSTSPNPSLTPHIIAKPLF